MTRAGHLLGTAAVCGNDKTRVINGHHGINYRPPQPVIPPARDSRLLTTHTVRRVADSRNTTSIA